MANKSKQHLALPSAASPSIWQRGWSIIIIMMIIISIILVVAFDVKTSSEDMTQNTFVCPCRTVFRPYMDSGPETEVEKLELLETKQKKFQHANNKIQPKICWQKRIFFFFFALHLLLKMERRRIWSMWEWRKKVCVQKKSQRIKNK